jgi:hypothetical protein
VGVVNEGGVDLSTGVFEGGIEIGLRITLVMSSIERVHFFIHSVVVEAGGQFGIASVVGQREQTLGAI